MTISNLLRIFEDLLYDLLSWIVFIPKTLILAAVPGKPQKLVESQWQINEKERYDGIVSPILFYLIITIITTIMFSGASIFAFLNALLELRDFQMVSIFLASFMAPLLFAITIQLAKSIKTRTNFGSKQFRKQFEVQCLLFGASSLVPPIFDMMVRNPNTSQIILSFPILFSMVIPLVYPAWLQQSVLSNELKIDDRLAFILGIALTFGISLLVGNVFGDTYSQLYGLL